MERNYQTDNKTFMIYKDWESLLATLTYEQIGMLTSALYAFAKRGEQPEFTGALQVVFLVMSQQIERDGEKWEKVCKQRAENVKRRWEKQSQEDTTDTNVYTCIQKDTKHADIDKEKEEDTDTDIDTDTEKERVRADAPGSHAHTQENPFIPPQVAEVAAYCAERHNNINPQYFVDYFTANGWMLGKTPMHDWKAAVRRWEQSGIRPAAQQSQPQNGSINIAEVEEMLHSGLLG